MPNSPNTTARHTPGPWKVFICEETQIIGQDGWHIATVDEWNEEYHGHGADEANAHLIAAAPDLLQNARHNLAILTNLLHDLERIAGAPVLKGIRRQIDETRAAIRKAQPQGDAQGEPEVPCPNDPDGMHHVGCGCDI